MLTLTPVSSERSKTRGFWTFEQRCDIVRYIINCNTVFWSVFRYVVFIYIDVYVLHISSICFHFILSHIFRRLSSSVSQPSWSTRSPAARERSAATRTHILIADGSHFLRVFTTGRPNVGWYRKTFRRIFKVFTISKQYLKIENIINSILKPSHDWEYKKSNKKYFFFFCKICCFQTSDMPL